MITFKPKLFYLIVMVVIPLSIKTTQCMDLHTKLYNALIDNYNGYKNGDIKLFIQQKANINKQTNDGTLLHVAVSHNRYNRQHNNIIKIFVNNKANINAKNSSGHTPLHYALQHGTDDKIIKFLVKNKATIEIHNNNFSWDFFIRNDNNINLMSFLYDSGIDFLKGDRLGKTIKDYARDDSLKKILIQQRDKRTPEEQKQVKTFLIINKIIAKKNKTLKVPLPILKIIFGYLKIPIHTASVPFF